jgi:hypothetical protein
MTEIGKDIKAEHRKAYLKEWRKANEDRVREYNKQKYANNKLYYNKRNKDGYKTLIEKKPDYNRQRHLKSYGLTLKQWNEAFNSQNGCCKICGRHESGLKRSIVTDHDHVTGEFRGLLCDSCNTKLGATGIGNFKVTETLYSKALGYIKQCNN